MIELIRCLHSDSIKIKRLPIRLAHMLIPICLSILFLFYYAYSPWNTYDKIGAYLQVIGIGFPFLIGLFSVILAEQEQSAGNFYVMLSASKRLPVFFSKLILLIAWGSFSCLVSCLIFGIGLPFVLQEQVMIKPIFYVKTAFILLGSSICLYTLHLFLAFRFNKGISIGVAITESLVSALFLTGLGDVIWSYVPCSWSARFVTYALMMELQKGVLKSDCKVAILLCIIITIGSLLLYGIWAYRWEGVDSTD
ncbi:MAG: lantibiotic immunity ABC transporter MutG family permease subunit [Candidatus Galacturonibacter soehngenii]|nr:lantibiotic immunity ABC transporter MutG family permease subunit [Candidatus Galacturonibacter soehngenii]